MDSGRHLTVRRDLIAREVPEATHACKGLGNVGDSDWECTPSEGADRKARRLSFTTKTRHYNKDAG